MNDNWKTIEKKFDEKFGKFYIYAKSGSLYYVVSKAGVKIKEIDFEGNNPVGSDDIKAFLKECCMPREEGLKCMSTRDSESRCDKLAEYIYLGKSYCDEHQDIMAKEANG